MFALGQNRLERLKAPQKIYIRDSKITKKEMI